MHNCPPSVSCLDCLLRDTHFFAHFSQTTHNVFSLKKTDVSQATAKRKPFHVTPKKKAKKKTKESHGPQCSLAFQMLQQTDENIQTGLTHIHKTPCFNPKAHNQTAFLFFLFLFSNSHHAHCCSSVSFFFISLFVFHLWELVLLHSRSVHLLLRGLVSGFHVIQRFQPLSSFYVALLLQIDEKLTSVGINSDNGETAIRRHLG